MKDDWLEEKLKEDNPSQPEHLRKIWGTAENADLPFEIDLDQAWANIDSKMVATKRKNSKIWLLPLAAVLLLSLGFPFLKRDKTYSTHPGEFKKIDLSDGSQIELNANSKIVIQAGFHQSHRTLSLNGEAYFKVAKADKTFRIETALAEIQVVGTHFNVKTNSSYIEVSVQEGHVKVMGEKEVVDLTPGQWLRVNPDGSSYQKSNIPIHDWPTWHHNHFYFDRTPLKHAVAEASSHFGIAIKCSQSIKDELVSGLVEAKDAQAFSQAIALLLGKTTENRNNEFVIK